MTTDEQEVSPEVMTEALATGAAVAMSDVVTDIVRYQDAWWVITVIGWLRIRDERLVAQIDVFAARLGAILNVAEDQLSMRARGSAK